MSIDFRHLSAIFVVFAVAASVMASPAAAITDDFEAPSHPYIVTGTAPAKQTVFKFSGGAETICSASGLNGTISESPAQSLTLQPTYGGCTLAGMEANIDTPCYSLFTGETNFFGHGIVHLECPKEPVRITVNGCIVEIGEQTPEQGATYTNNEKGKVKDIDFKVTAQNLTYKPVGTLCALIAGLTGELSIVGEYTVKAYKDVGGAEGEQIPFTVKSTF